MKLLRCLSLSAMTCLYPLLAQTPRTPACTEDKGSNCWIEVDNQLGCQFWNDDEAPSLKADWSGECAGGLAQGKGTVTWDICIWDNGACMPFEVQQSGSFLNGRRQGKWIEGPSDAMACHRWNTEMYFKTATAEDVKACLATGADVNAQDSQYQGNTPLHFAVERNEPPMVEVLLEAGADVKARKGGGGTPLHEARSPVVVEMLLKAGADLNALDDRLNTPLHGANKYHSNSAVTEALLKAGADVKAQNANEVTALHFASRNLAFRTIELLLKAGGEVDAPDNRGNTPLHEAVEVHGTYEKIEVVEALLAAGANPMARNQWGRTALHEATINGNPALYRVLLEAGADVKARDHEGKTPLHLAARSDQLDGIEVLLAAGADLKARDNDGMTPLHLAARFDQPDAIEFLLAAGADLKARDNEGNIPLHALFASDVRIGPKEVPEEITPISVEMESLEVLLKAGSNLEAQNNEGNTPLHLAAKYLVTLNGVVWGFNELTGYFHHGHWGQQPHHAGDSVRAMLATGADPRVKNKQGKTPCDLYRSNIFLRTEKIRPCR